MKQKILLFGALACTTALCSIEAEAESATLERIFNFAHEQYIARYEPKTVPTPAIYETPLRKIFGRLFSRASLPLVPYEIRVVDEPGLNASTTVGPYFTINLNLLNAISKRAKELAAPGGPDQAYKREMLLAGVLSHEIGHFLAGHGLRYFAKQAPGAAFDPQAIKTAIRHSQEDEFDADKIGYQLMEAAGYGGENLYHALRLLHDDMQRICESKDAKMKESCRSYSYADSHPAMSARLARFDNENTKFHEEMLKLEIAVAWVNQGINLRSALQIIDAELKLSPKNSYFLKIQAFAYHKLWLESVPLADQQLRVIIAVPAFHDKMASGKRKSKGATEIPGDKALYYRAKKVYEQAITAAAPPPYFQSAYLTLLAYDADELQAALKKSTRLEKTSGDIAVKNNHALILYLAGKKTESLKSFIQLAGPVDTAFQKLMQSAQSNSEDAQKMAQFSEHSKKMQIFDAGFIHTEFTPLLNAALIMAMESPGSDSGKLAAYYIQQYDGNSHWAKRLATLTKQTLPETAVAENSIFSRLNINTPKVKYGDKAGKETKPIALPDGGQIYYVDQGRMRVVTQAGAVRGITVSPGSDVKIDGKIGIGSTRAEVEKLWGKSTRNSDGYVLYGAVMTIGIRYDNDRVAEFTMQ